MLAAWLALPFDDNFESVWRYRFCASINVWVVVGVGGSCCILRRNGCVWRWHYTYKRGKLAYLWVVDLLLAFVCCSSKWGEIKKKLFSSSSSPLLCFVFIFVSFCLFVCVFSLANSFIPFSTYLEKLVFHVIMVGCFTFFASLGNILKWKGRSYTYIGSRKNKKQKNK